MRKLSSFLFIILFFNIELIAMEKRPYHHLPDGTFRNPEGSPERDPNAKWSYKIFNEERKKVKIEKYHSTHGLIDIHKYDDVRMAQILFDKKFIKN